MKNKLIYLIILVLIATGCNANYTINIDDGFIKEELIISNYEKNTIEEKLFFETHLGIHYYPNYEIYSTVNSPNKKYYQKTKNNQNDDIKVAYNFKKEEYSNSAIIKNCFEKFTYSSTDRFSTINAERFTCFSKFPNLNRVNINIKTDFSIINTNGETNDQKTYNWTITRDNADYAAIIFIFPNQKTDNIELEDDPVEGGSLDAEGRVDFNNEYDNEDIEIDEEEDINYDNDNNDNNPKSDSVSSSDKETKDNSPSYILILIVLGIILFSGIVALIIFITNKKNNKI